MVITPAAVRLRLLRAARVQAGLCRCGRPPKPNRRICEVCAEANRAADEARKAAGLKRVWAPVDPRKARP